MQPPESSASGGESGRSFARLYEEHIWHVYGYVAYRVNSREQAEDLTQATFERALKAWRRYDPSRASEQTWLLSIARNVVIDGYRRNRVRVETLDEVDEREHPDLISPGPEPELGLSPELEAALQSVSQRDREVIALRFGGDMSGSEIAELMDLSLANVQQILSRSLRKMRERLEGAGDGPPERD
jgi:RNA polymerase sigma-70 factor (ECF subfamily)